ncbi:MAG: hypothetical protein GXP04_05295 [Alphaproteobacteria bacterium]|nr:hypothetical protein [Alphaproteobacteria bacterium]
MKPAIVILPLIFLLISCGTFENSKEHTLQDVLAKIDEENTLLVRLDKCPADYYQSTRKISHEYFENADRCLKSPDRCLKKCLAKSADHCQDLGLALQQQKNIAEHYADQLFAASCAMGNPSGCTNRTSRMSLATPDRKENAQCIMRSYNTSCQADDPWGCTMYGAEIHRQGTGQQKEMDAAFNKACDLDVDFEACTHAKTLRSFISSQ